MEINVAGAGSGKTTLMSKLITSSIIPNGKNVFCIAFTNAAVDNIVDKVKKKLVSVPDNIKISTIHSFLYQEFIMPYYYFLYGKQFERLSDIELSENNKYNNIILSDLEEDNILHVTKIPEKAKWVVYGKSTDNRAIKNLREKVLKRFSLYCSAIYVDEAQDLSKDIRIILDSLDNIGVKIILYGDPKQDVKGRGQFREIIKSNINVKFISNCYRCPQKHLNLSNTLATEEEYQFAEKGNAEGSINIVFESDINIHNYLATEDFGLKYISMKRDRFDTHAKSISEKRFDKIYYLVRKAIIDKWKRIKSEIEINRASFYCTEQMIKLFNGNNAAVVISKQVERDFFNYLDKRRFAQISSALSEDIRLSNNPVINTIEIVKGLEAERCLFILSPDLAPYLFGEKDADNKTKHLLYVALTRSLDNLTIMIMTEVEMEYKRRMIEEFFAKYI